MGFKCTIIGPRKIDLVHSNQGLDLIKLLRTCGKWRILILVIYANLIHGDFYPRQSLQTGMASLVRAVNKDVFISQRVSNGHLLTTSRERVTQRESVGRSFHLVTTSILKYGR